MLRYYLSLIFSPVFDNNRPFVAVHRVWKTGYSLLCVTFFCIRYLYILAQIILMFRVLKVQNFPPRI